MERVSLLEILIWVTLSAQILPLATLVVMCTDCIGSYKSNYHTITTVSIFNHIYFFFKKETKIRVTFFFCKGM